MLGRILRASGGGGKRWIPDLRAWKVPTTIAFGPRAANSSLDPTTRTVDYRT